MTFANTLDIVEFPIRRTIPKEAYKVANKKVPVIIAGTPLHPLARARTNALLRKLEDEGAPGVATAALSMIDRFRLLSSAYFTLILGVEEKAESVPPATTPPTEENPES